VPPAEPPRYTPPQPSVKPYMAHEENHRRYLQPSRIYREMPEEV